MVDEEYDCHLYKLSIRLLERNRINWAVIMLPKFVKFIVHIIVYCDLFQVNCVEKSFVLVAPRVCSGSKGLLKHTAKPFHIKGPCGPNWSTFTDTIHEMK